MIGVIVTIGPDAELTRERASAVAEQEGPKPNVRFVEVSALIDNRMSVA